MVTKFIIVGYKGITLNQLITNNKLYIWICMYMHVLSIDNNYLQILYYNGFHCFRKNCTVIASV